MSNPIQPIDTIAPAAGPKRNENKSQAQLDFEEGRGYIERGEATMAAVALHNALRGFEEVDDRLGVANASNQLGHACLLQKEYEKALLHYRRAWDICQEHGDGMSLLALSRQFVEVHKGRQDYRAAVDQCLELLDSYQRNNNPQGSVETLEQMADIYVLAQEPGKAADALRTAASIHANFGHKSIAEGLRKRADELAAQVE